MNLELRRFTALLTPQVLGAALLAGQNIESEAMAVTADLGPPMARAEELVSAGSGKVDRASWDRELVEPLHSALHRLPRRMATDMRFWHWLCVKVMPRFVWARWYGSVPEEFPADGISKSLAGRFLGKQTLHGVSRNALARLWWCGEALHSPGDGYHIAREALENQDFFQAIFERKLGLYPPAARACVRTLKNASEEKRRTAIKRLNHYLTTIALEVLSEEDIVGLLAEE